MPKKVFSQRNSMTRLREKDVYKICISKEESNKLLDYENN